MQLSQSQIRNWQESLLPLSFWPQQKEQQPLFISRHLGQIKGLLKSMGTRELHLTMQLQRVTRHSLLSKRFPLRAEQPLGCSWPRVLWADFGGFSEAAMMWLIVAGSTAAGVLLSWRGLRRLSGCQPDKRGLPWPHQLKTLAKWKHG